MIANFICSLHRMAVNAIIRPPRALYDKSKIPNTVNVPSYGPVIRQEASFTNDRGQRLVGSYYAPNEDIANVPCVIYLHGNASCQLEGTFLVPIFVPHRCAVFCFDTSGCGNSEGEYISLGYYESADLKAAIKFLKDKYRVGKIGIWGRSMGAATGLISLHFDEIAVAVIDSPFVSLREMIFEVAKNFPVPTFLIKGYALCLKRKINLIMDFSINDVNPLESAKNCTKPLFLIHGENDTFIPCQHSQRIFQEYAGTKKSIEIVPDANHNTVRPHYVNILAILHIANELGLTIDVESIPTIQDTSSCFHFENTGNMLENE